MALSRAAPSRATVTRHGLPAFQTPAADRPVASLRNPRMAAVRSLRLVPACAASSARRSSVTLRTEAVPTVNPEILVWARETAGLTLQEAAAKVGIKDARGVEASDRLAALESGEKSPTRALLVRMARQYRRPLLAFYLSAPPPSGERGADFRTLPAGRASKTDALVDALVRDVRVRQNMIRAALEAENEARSLPFVGVVLRSEGTVARRQSLQSVLKSPPAAAELARHAQRALCQVLGEDLNAARYYSEPTPMAAFSLLRSRVENAGVFVVLKGDLGSHHTDIPVEAFRGFAVAEDVAPFVIINDNDSVPAWSFTLLHELVHLLLGQTGFSGIYSSNRKTETFCNEVAAEWLLPEDFISQIDIEWTWDITEQRRCIEEFAQKRNLSRTMVAYRLLRSGRIDGNTMDQLRTDFRVLWRCQRNRIRTRRRESKGGPSYYAIQCHRTGWALLQLTGRMIENGTLSPTKAARVLGVKSTQVYDLLFPA